MLDAERGGGDVELGETAVAQQQGRGMAGSRRMADVGVEVEPHVDERDEPSVEHRVEVPSQGREQIRPTRRAIAVGGRGRLEHGRKDGGRNAVTGDVGDETADPARAEREDVIVVAANLLGGHAAHPTGQAEE